MERGQFLVETSWLAEHLEDPHLRVVDMRGYVRTVEHDGVQDAFYVGARNEYEEGHIPGALYIDWSSDIVDPDDAVEAQIAPAAHFGELMGRLGIGDQHLVVVYDSHPASQFATRLWWAPNYYGHDQVVVVNGGLPKWQRENLPLVSEIPTYAPTTFTAVPQPQLRATAEDVVSFLGQPGVTLIDPATGTFRSNDDLARMFTDFGVKPEDRVVAYCNGGVAATTVLFSLAMLGYPRLTNYDGSWNEWGERQDLPAEIQR